MEKKYKEESCVRSSHTEKDGLRYEKRVVPGTQLYRHFFSYSSFPSAFFIVLILQRLSKGPSGQFFILQTGTFDRCKRVFEMN